MLLEIYRKARKFPKEEVFGLTIQLKKAASSVTANISEGMGRHSYKDRVNYFYISRGSLYEVENFIIMAKDLKYITLKEYEDLIEQIKETRKTLNGFITSTEMLAK